MINLPIPASALILGLCMLNRLSRSIFLTTKSNCQYQENLLKLAHQPCWLVSRQFSASFPETFFNETSFLGWGRLDTNGPISSVLQKVDLQVYNFYDCSKIHEPGEISYNNICTDYSCLLKPKIIIFMVQFPRCRSC